MASTNNAIDLSLVPTSELMGEIERRCDAYVFSAVGLASTSDSADAIATVYMSGPLVTRLGLAHGLMRDADARWDDTKFVADDGEFDEVGDDADNED